MIDQRFGAERIANEKNIAFGDFMLAVGMGGQVLEVT